MTVRVLGGWGVGVGGHADDDMYEGGENGTLGSTFHADLLPSLDGMLSQKTTYTHCVYG